MTVKCNLLLASVALAMSLSACATIQPAAESGEVVMCPPSAPMAQI